MSRLLNPLTIASSTSFSRSVKSVFLLEAACFAMSLLAGHPVRGLGGIFLGRTVWIARSIDSPSMSFLRKPSAPAAIAILAACSYLTIVKTTILTFGMQLFISAIVSTPHGSGISRSIKITSGCRLLALRTASLQSSASPTTWVQGSVPKNIWMPLRAAGWSSAISTRIRFIFASVGSTCRKASLIAATNRFR